MTVKPNWIKCKKIETTKSFKRMIPINTFVKKRSNDFKKIEEEW